MKYRIERSRDLTGFEVLTDRSIYPIFYSRTRKGALGWIASRKRSLIGRVKIVQVWNSWDPWGPKDQWKKTRGLDRLVGKVQAARPQYYVSRVALLDGKPLAIVAQPENGRHGTRMLLSVRAPHTRLLKTAVHHSKLLSHVYALAKEAVR